MPAVNSIAVLLAALSGFLLGGLWYGPLFGKAWMAENGYTMESVAKDFNPVKAYGATFVFAFIASWTFAMALGPEVYWKRGALYGFVAGLCWVGMAMATSYIFERRSFRHWAINAGYHTIQFTLIGAIVGLMN